MGIGWPNWTWHYLKLLGNMDFVLDKKVMKVLASIDCKLGWTWQVRKVGVGPFVSLQFASLFDSNYQHLPLQVRNMHLRVHCGLCCMESGIDKETKERWKPFSEWH